MITLNFVSSSLACLSNSRFVSLTAFSASPLEFLLAIMNLTALPTFLPSCFACDLSRVSWCQPSSPSHSIPKSRSDPWLSFTAYTQFISKSCWLYFQNVFKFQLPSHELCYYHQPAIISHLDYCSNLLSGLSLSVSRPYVLSCPQGSEGLFTNVVEIMWPLFKLSHGFPFRLG